MVAVFHKGPWRRAPEGRGTDLTRDEFLEWTLGVWTFPGESPQRAKDLQRHRDWLWLWQPLISSPG